MNIDSLADPLAPGDSNFLGLEDPLAEVLGTPDSYGITPPKSIFSTPKCELGQPSDFLSGSAFPPTASRDSSPVYHRSLERSVSCQSLPPKRRQFSPPITPADQFIPDPIYNIPPKAPHTHPSFLRPADSEGLFSTRIHTTLESDGVSISLAAVFNDSVLQNPEGTTTLDCRLEVKAPSLVYDQQRDFKVVTGDEVRISGRLTVSGELYNAALVKSTLFLRGQDSSLESISLAEQADSLTHDPSKRTITICLMDGNAITLTFFHHGDHRAWLECLLNPYLGTRNVQQLGDTPMDFDEATRKALQSPFAPCYNLRKQLNLLLLLPCPDHAGVTMDALESVIGKALKFLGLFDRLAVSFFGSPDETTTGFHRVGSHYWNDEKWKAILSQERQDLSFDRLVHVNYAAQTMSQDKIAQNKDAVYSMCVISDCSTDLDSLFRDSTPPIDLAGSLYSIDYNGNTSDIQMEHLAMRSNGGSVAVNCFNDSARPLIALIKSERCCVACDVGVALKVKSSASIRSLSLRRGRYREFDIDPIKRDIGKRILCPLGHVREGETYCLDLQITMNTMGQPPGTKVWPFEAFLRQNSPGTTTSDSRQSGSLQIQTMLETAFEPVI